MAESRIDPGQLVDLIEGRLSPAERESLMRRLAASPNDLELLAGIIRAREGWDPNHAAEWKREEQSLREAPPEGTPPSRFTAFAGRIRFPPRWLTGAAAAAVIAAVFIGPRLFDASPSRDMPDVTSAELTALLSRNPSPGSGWEQPPWQITRGSTRVSADTVLALRLGARLVDLQIARMVGDSLAGMVLRAERDSMILVLPASQTLMRLFAAADRDESGAALGPAEARLAERVDEYHLLRGKWLRAAYWAARYREDAFFDSGVVRRALDELSGRVGVDWNGIAGPARTALDSISFGSLTSRIEEVLRGS